MDRAGNFGGAINDEPEREGRGRDVFLRAYYCDMFRASVIAFNPNVAGKVSERLSEEKMTQKISENFVEQE